MRTVVEGASGIPRECAIWSKCLPQQCILSVHVLDRPFSKQVQCCPWHAREDGGPAILDAIAEILYC